MPRRALIGSRIRDRRTFMRIKQADLARSVGISPSYLNLIEHNRRAIAGKLLADLARVLEVETSALSEGAEAALLVALRAAVSANPAEPGEPGAEVDRIEEFAGRFPGWAALAAAQHRRVETLERTAEILSDRLTHDPYLSASMHDVLSTVTAIRSSAAILAEPGEIDPNWQARFHKNIHEDAQRLSESAQALVSYLDDAGDAETSLTAPQEELEAFLAKTGFHVDALEEPGADAGVINALIADAGRFSTAAARAMAGDYLARYLADARVLPLGPFREAVKTLGHDPGRLAQALGCSLMQAMRRLAGLPETEGAGALIGLVSCDASGTLTHRKPVPGFQLPRFGAACPLWPLYQALVRPMTPIRTLIEQAGRNPRPCLAYAVAEPRYPEGFEGPMVLEAQMLIVASQRPPTEPDEVQQVGQSCRICPRRACVARREASILSDGF